GVNVRSTAWETDYTSIEKSLTAGSRLSVLRREYDTVFAPVVWEQRTDKAALFDARAATSALIRAASEATRTLKYPAPTTHSSTDLLAHIALRSLDAPDLRGVQVGAEDWRLRFADLHRLLASGNHLS